MFSPVFGSFCPNAVVTVTQYIRQRCVKHRNFFWLVEANHERAMSAKPPFVHMHGYEVAALLHP
jgi:hypothetical protein